MLSTVKSLRYVAVFVAALCCASTPAPKTFAQNTDIGSNAGRVISHVDGVSVDGPQPYVWGWACEQGQATSILVRIYADHAPDDTPKGAFILATKADLDNEPGVGRACQDQLGKHRFKVALPGGMFAKGQQRKAYIQGIPVSGAIPPLSGMYTRMAGHPGVFTTRPELEWLAERVNIPDSYSAKRFSQLTARIGRDLAARNAWGATYSGCHSDTYTYAFSYEPQVTDAVNHAATMNSDFRLNPGALPPAGAAVVASQLALYAALVKAGAVAPEGAPSADRAAALAKQILVAWSVHGFQEGRGHFLSTPSQFCDVDGKTNDAVMAGVGLLVARGVIYSVQAQDLLMYLGTLTDTEVNQVNAFHSAMYELIRNALNYQFVEHHAWGCDHFGNQPANQLAALLALGRVLDNQKQFEAALYGDDPSIRVTLPWTVLFDNVIYGEADAPHSCYFNTGADGLTSRPFFQTAVVAPGELDDRYRNADPAQGIGYPMFSLERLFDAAEILRIAGYDPYGYRGVRGQSLEMATTYYACYAKGAGFANTVTADNSKLCPDAAQYYGKVVNGVDRLLTIGAVRFPKNASIIDLEATAQAASSSGAFSLDSILFGKWRN